MESKHLVFFLVMMNLTFVCGSVRAIDTYTTSLEAGQYIGYDVAGPWTGLMREDGSYIGNGDDPSVFGWPSHVEADFLWFTSGWMQWSYPLTIPDTSVVKSLSYTIEISSETGCASWDWPSDVIININGVDIDTWVIPSDPDAKYGYAYQENHLDEGSSQYGWLCTWTVDETGTYLEYLFRLGNMQKTKVSDVTIEDLNIMLGQPINVKISVPYDDSNPMGGINIYGDYWGDYDYDPTITVAVIPEPAILSLLGFGGLALLRRKRGYRV